MLPFTRYSSALGVLVILALILIRSIFFFLFFYSMREGGDFRTIDRMHSQYGWRITAKDRNSLLYAFRVNKSKNLGIFRAQGLRISHHIYFLDE